MAPAGWVKPETWPSGKTPSIADFKPGLTTWTDTNSLLIFGFNKEIEKLKEKINVMYSNWKEETGLMNDERIKKDEEIAQLRKEFARAELEEKEEELEKLRKTLGNMKEKRQKLQEKIKEGQQVWLTEIGLVPELGKEVEAVQRDTGDLGSGLTLASEHRFQATFK